MLCVLISGDLHLHRLHGRTSFYGIHAPFSRPTLPRPSTVPSHPPPLRSKCSTTHFFLSRLHSHLIKSIETAAAMLHACLSRPPRQPWGETRFNSMGTGRRDGRGRTRTDGPRLLSQPEAEGGEAETPARRSTSALVAEAHLPRLWLRREWTGQLAPRRRCSHGQARLAPSRTRRRSKAKALRNNRLREGVTFLRRKFCAGWLNFLTCGNSRKYHVIFLYFE